jgi:uncharacterized membrane protein YkoI
MLAAGSPGMLPLVAVARLRVPGRTSAAANPRRITMRTRIVAGVLAFFSLSALAVAVRADEEEIPRDKVPAPVLAAARDKFPGAQIREASKETEDGQTVFELSFTHEGHKMDVTFRENGTLVLVETVVSENDVPGVVTRAVTDKYPGAKVDLVESVTKGPEVKREADYFEFHLTTADKESAEVEVDARGKILKTEQKTGKDEDR